MVMLGRYEKVLNLIIRRANHNAVSDSIVRLDFNWFFFSASNDANNQQLAVSVLQMTMCAFQTV